MASNSARVVIHDNYDGRGYTNEETLTRYLQKRPDKINPVLTFLQGRDSTDFPLTFLTEGQVGGVKPIEVSTIEYEHDVIRRLKRSDAIISHNYSGSDKPGLGNTPIYVVFETNWLKEQHIIRSPRGIQLRIQGKPQPYGVNYRYKLRMVQGNATAFVPLTELLPQTRWSMSGGAPVSQSFSKGNASNIQTPGKMKNQISILRKSMRWGGNIAKKEVECVFNIDGKQTSYWMPFEMWQHQLEWKRSCEEHYWYSLYNRQADGSISLTDEDSELPIPIGAGILDQIPNNDTYGFLTAKKLKNTVRDVMFQTTDSADAKMDIVLYTGLGGLESFDEAMKEDLKGLGFSVISDNLFVSGAGRNLSLGGFFTQYKHIDGHVVTVKHNSLFDSGGAAENAPPHPVTGLPLTSYEMVFLDQSTYGGVKNIQMVTEKGRAMRTGLLKGMATIPDDWAGSDQSNLIADEVDQASMHFLSAKGVNINRPTNCFRLTCDLS
jgi:hypothetical protein